MTRAIGLIGLASIWIATATPASAPQRDFSSYSTLGPLLLLHPSSVFTNEDRELFKSQMRRFLIDSWQHHRRARLIVVTTTLEGLPTLWTYYVEPDSADVWHVVIDTIRTLPGTKPSGEHYTEDDTVTGTAQIYDASDGQRHIRIISGDRTLEDL
jgi:hypothetical protein